MRLPRKASVLGKPRHLPGKQTFLERAGLPRMESILGKAMPFLGRVPSWEAPPPSWDGNLPGKPLYLLRKDAFLGRLFLPKLVIFLGRERPFWEESLPRKVSGY